MRYKDRQVNSYPPLDECELVVRVQQGDQWAFDALYGKYNNQISLYPARWFVLYLSASTQNRLRSLENGFSA